MKIKIIHLIITNVIFVLFCFIFTYLFYTSSVNKLSADLKTVNAVKFQVHNMEEKEFTREIIEKKGMLDKVSLYEISLEDDSYRVIINSTYFLSPHVIEGKFLGKEDYDYFIPKAVVGKNRLSETYINEGKRKIKIFDIEYTVVGVVGYDDEYSLNDYIFLNTINENEKKPIFLLDALSRQSVNLVIKELELCYDIEIISEKINNIDRAYQYSYFNLILAVMLTLLIVVLLSYIIYLQYTYFYSVISTFSILGFAKNEIKKFNRKFVFINGIICFLISFMGSGILFSSSPKIHQLLDFIIITILLLFIYIGYLVICEVVLTAIYINWRRKNERMHKKRLSEK